jgi:hypothetical protein
MAIDIPLELTETPVFCWHHATYCKRSRYCFSAAMCLDLKDKTHNVTVIPNTNSAIVPNTSNKLFTTKLSTSFTHNISKNNDFKG